MSSDKYPPSQHGYDYVTLHVTKHTVTVTTVITDITITKYMYSCRLEDDYPPNPPIPSYSPTMGGGGEGWGPPHVGVAGCHPNMPKLSQHKYSYKLEDEKENTAYDKV